LIEQKLIEQSLVNFSSVTYIFGITRLSVGSGWTIQIFVVGQATSEQQAEQYPLQHSVLMQSLLRVHAFPGALPVTKQK
jgi:hypothetical protein